MYIEFNPHKNLKRFHVVYMFNSETILIKLFLDVCKPFITGQIQCLAYQRRYKYDATSGDCMQFIYGGCGGNSNNFGSVEACRRKCVPERPRPAVTTESPIEGSGDGGEGTVLFSPPPLMTL